MQPNEPSDDRNISVPPRTGAGLTRPEDRTAAISIIRDQIDRVYDEPVETSQEPIVVTGSQTYTRSHDDQTAHESINKDDWTRYHSAWQQYYQQYYERYYLNHLATQQKTLTSSAPAETQFPVSKPQEIESQQEKAIHSIRDELLEKVRTHSTRVRQSRHFWPVASAIIVMLIFTTLQYNRLMVAQVKAYVSPGTINPQNIIVDPTTSTVVSAEPKLIIPKINVDAPVIFDLNTVAEAPVQNALKNGVVHYPIPGASGFPGQKGNTVILGHSSNDVFDDGNYKFIFVQLDKLQKGDTFYIHYLGTRYTYSVTGKEIIDPTEVGKLIIDTDKPLASLVTCTPPGTALKRLVVYAEQISPDPESASEGNQTTNSDTATTIAGNSPTVLERLFGQ